MSQILILSISSILVFSDFWHSVLVIVLLYFCPALCYLTQLPHSKYLPPLALPPPPKQAHTHIAFNLTHVHALIHAEKHAANV